MISTRLLPADRLGAWKCRWGLGRMSYTVPAGLYALGTPTAEDPVVVTANYKMSYDIVRRELDGGNVWLLVLETNGINVWCAAGKGTFGTAELVKRIETTALASLVTHRVLVLPVLGAPGVASHEVRKRTGFIVRYAAIRVSDLPRFLANGMRTEPEMRELTFTTRERLSLTPIEVFSAFRKSFPFLVLLFLAGAFSVHTFSPLSGLHPVLACSGAILAGSLATPVLLPWLPSRYFSVKGATTGFLWALILFLFYGGYWNTLLTLSAFLVLPAISSFIALNFTGSTPFTSPSGVRKEMRQSLPVLATVSVLGVVLFVVGLLTG